MTKEQAYEKLELAVGADLQLVRKQFAKLHNDFQVRIDNAPTPKLKQAFERGQEELKEAYALLNESDSVDDTRSLPYSERSFEDDNMGTEPHVKQTAQELGLDQALALFGVSSSHAATEIEATMQRRISKLREQYQAVDLATAKDAFTQEISKLEKAQKIVLNWLSEKKKAEQVQSQRAAEAQAAPLSPPAPPPPPAPQKRHSVWLYLLPLLLVAGGVVYYITQQTDTVIPVQPQVDVTAGKDSVAWHSALAGNSEKTYTYYLKEYPSGIFAKAARDSLTKIAGAKAAAKSAAAGQNNQQQADQQAEKARQEQEQLAAAERKRQEDAKRIEQERQAAAERKREEGAKKAAVPVPQMVRVAGGSFQMGSNNGFDWEKPVHKVRLSSYSIGKYEVTFDEFDAFCDATGRDKPGDEGWGRGRRPVINVSWHDAVAYCNWLSDKTGQSYRLPTEAEWEFAARGGNSSRGTEYSGSNSISSVAWHADNAGIKTHPVGQKSPNELGLYDMSGNVWEWCSDWYGDYNSSSQSNPKGPEAGDDCVLRGASWRYGAVYCRVTCRRRYALGDRDGESGFRVARSE